MYDEVVTPPLSFKAKLAIFLTGVMLLSSGAGIISPVIAHAATAAAQNVAKVSFTFDDGLSSATLAQQTLSAYGYTGTDYIITNCVGMTTAPNTCAADPNDTYMTYDQITALKAAGWEIGSHTESHPLTAAADNPSLTDQQLDAELATSQLILNAKGFNAIDYASPYGDYDNRSLAVSSKYYNSHRAFQDYVQPTTAQDTVTPTFPYYSPRNVYPYNNALLPVEEVQGNIPVATVEKYVDTAIANNQWLILVFHKIVPTGASKLEADYQYNATDLATIAAYVKSKSLPVVNIEDGTATGTDLMTNSGFNDGIADGWTTDSTTIIADKQTSSFAGHGSYDGTATGPWNSVAINAPTVQSHLFSPQIAVTAGTTYTAKNFVNVTSTTGGVNFWVDSYNAAGTIVSSQRALGPNGTTAANAVQVGNVNFTFTPAAGVTKVRVYADIAPGTTGYIDNMQVLSPDGATVPVTPPSTTSNGDINGDGKVDALDLSTLLTNWNKTGATAAQGDLNGDTKVDALDLSTLLTNWSK